MLKWHHWFTLVILVAVAYYAGMQGWFGKFRTAVTG